MTKLQSPVSPVSTSHSALDANIALVVFLFTPERTLKRCLHYDPNSKPCLAEGRALLGLNKFFSQLDELLGKEDWRGVVGLLLSPSSEADDLQICYEEVLLDRLVQESKVLPLVPYTPLFASMKLLSQRQTKRRNSLFIKVSP